MDEKTNLEKLIIARRMKNNKKKKRIPESVYKEQTKDWCTFYRRNWNIYAKHSLGIKLHFFQEVAIYLCGISDVFYMMCSRGLSKTFMAAIIAVIEAMLYPRSEIVLTATTIKTARKMVNEKIRDELCSVFSPKLKWLYDNGFIKFVDNEDEVRIKFLFNDSSITVLPQQESARGSRATMLVFEECRLLKKVMVDSVFIPMRHARVPAYRANNDEYKKDPLLIERAKIIYLTSTRYKYEWFWRQWVITVNNFFGNKKLKYNIFAGDMYVATAHGFMTDEDIEAGKIGMSDMEFRMEYLNEPIGEVEGAFYTLEMFKKNSIIQRGLVPPTYEEYITKYYKGELPWFREKKKDEIRAIYVDFAFTDTVSKTKDSDNTVIGCMSGFPNDTTDKVLRNIEYMETYSGGKKDESILRIRELFFFYDADVLIVDARNGGEDRMIDLTKPFYHEEMGLNMNGFGMYRDDEILSYFTAQAKVENLRKRTVDPNAIPVIIPVYGQDDRNNNYHLAMKAALENGSIRLLIDEIELKNELSEEGLWAMMSPNERMRHSLGHVQLDIMVEEAIKLEQSLKKGFIALNVVGSNKRDRIVATEYANYFFHLLELKMLKKKYTPDVDYSAWDVWG